ncbi:unnamed protein product, partial [Allacma fusca]
CTLRTGIDRYDSSGNRMQ